MKLYRYLLPLLILLASNLWASTFPVRLLSERHRTEWNWVEYRLSLRNLSNSPLVNPTIRYFAENPRIQYCKAHPNNSSCEGMAFDVYDVDSTLRAVVDYHSLVHSVIPSFYYDSKYTAISLKFHGTIPAQATSVVHFRIMKENYPAWDCSHDYSYQANAATHENYKMAVYDGDGNILWGNDPVAVNRDTVNVYWYDRAGMTVVSQYDGSDSAKTFNGRFWLLKENSLTDEERASLNQIGVTILETSRYQDKGMHLLKSALPIKKKTLDSTLFEFYNAFVADDTTRIPLILYPVDIYEQTQTCDANDSCTTVVNTRSAIDMVVECWPDLAMSECKQVVMQCSGDTAYIDRRVILAKVHRDSILCLETHRNVRYVHVRRKGIPFNDKGRKSINLTELQNSTKWQDALLAQQVTTNWLNGADYTGEGVSVGVYDDGFDFMHPGLMELDANGGYKTRKANADNDSWTSVENKNVKEHGTHVAGIIGGNGRMSETITNASPYQFRGVAPKVKFYLGMENFYNQRGDVINHSHGVDEGQFYGRDQFNEYKYIDLAYYGIEHRTLDGNIFRDWKDVSDLGDSRSKTIVLAAGNNGKRMEFSKLLGYYSITNDSKNAILVGSFDPVNYTLSGFSSLGPTWDGRIKPDIMAPGTNIMSSVPVGLMGVNYIEFSGTSMAAPFVSGVAALMYQKFKRQTGISLDDYSMRNSTTKALLIHSAIDMVGCDNVNADIANLNQKISQTQTCTPYTQGPDFATGWGRVDAKGVLDMMDGYNEKFGMFDKFREFFLSEKGVNGENQNNEKRWSIFVPRSQKKIRATLVWDDSPGEFFDIENYMTLKLVNDLDLYLLSPTGKIYYPWRLDALPTQIVNKYGQKFDDAILKNRQYEQISFNDANTSAYRNCKGEESTAIVDDECFDRRNNVEVVDVDNPEPGIWHVVAKGHDVKAGNSSDGKAQLASVVSDFELIDMLYDGRHPYVPNVRMGEFMDLGEGYLEHYVTFGPETFLGAGDHIYLYNEWNQLIGDFTGNSLANRRIIVNTRFLKIILDSDDDDSQGWGYSITNVEHVPYGVLQVLFPPYKKGD